LIEDGNRPCDVAVVPRVYAYSLPPNRNMPMPRRARSYVQGILLAALAVGPLAGLALSGAAPDAAADPAPATAPKPLTPRDDLPRQDKELNGKVQALHDQGRFAEAIPLALEVVRVRKEGLGEADPRYATSLNKLGSLYDATGDYAKAEPLYLQAMQIYRQTVGEHHRAYGMSLSYLSSLYEHMGDYAKAELLCRQAIQVYKEALGERHLSYALSVNNLASLYDHMGDYVKAEPLYLQAMQIRKQALGEQHPDYAGSLSNLAGLYEHMADYARAEPLCRQALRIRKQALGEQHPDYAISLNNMATLYLDMGDYARAEPLCHQATQIMKQALGEQHPAYAISLTNLGLLYQVMGDYARAEPLYRQAIQISNQALGERHPAYAQNLNNLGLLYVETGDYAKAEPLYRQSIQLMKQALGEQHPDYATSLNNLAGLYVGMGNYAGAEPLYREALQITRQALGEQHPAYAQGLNNLGSLYARMGDYGKAEPLCRQAMQIRKQALGEQHPDYATSLNNLAALSEETGARDKAAALSSQALAITRRSLDLTAAVQSERQQLRMQKRMQLSLDAYLSVTQSVPGETYGPVLAWKGSVSQRQRQMRALRGLSAGQGADTGAGEARAAALGRDLGQASRTLATMILSTPNARQSADTAWLRQRDQKTTELSQRVETLQQELATVSQAYRTSLRAAGVKEVIEALPAQAALVDVLQYMHYSPPPQHRGPMTAERRLVAFVLRQGQGNQDVERVELGPAAAIDQSVEQWRRTLGTGAAGRAAGMELRQLVWEPLTSQLAGVTLVLFSPDGPLSRFPLEALPGAQAGHYLVEELAVAVVAVPQDLPQLLAAPAPPGQASMLAVGDVDYGTRDPQPPQQAEVAEAREAPQHQIAARGRDGMTWPALAGTGTEVDQVLARFQGAYGKDAGRRAVLRGSNATVQAVCAAAPRSRYIHLATHGFFSPLQVRAALSPSIDSRNAEAGFHPGLLSGIVLAGANHPPDANEDDGILTALEVSEMDLGHVDLAVLSACETGLGQAAGGEGLLGLQRAFQVAGARSVVASMWSVADAETQVLMNRFYQNLWEKKMTKVAALRDAQLWMLNGGASGTLAASRGLAFHPQPATQPLEPAGRLPPQYWAAFELSGDWR
jgi:CHAT domain-containing protein/tetratricopeptide (TPR) repeat protein